MLTGITESKQVAKLQTLFSKRLNEYSSGIYTTKLGHVGGSWDEKVNYSKELNIWWIFASSNNSRRYWNAFGVGEPGKTSRIVTEINYPKKGIDFRIAGNWVKDVNGKIFILHSGKITGKNVSKTVFISNYPGEIKESNIDGYARVGILIGEISNANFPFQVADFILKVSEIKNKYRNTDVKPTIHNFNNEFDGSKIYKLPEKVTSNSDHAIIVNELEKVLKKMGKYVGNNGSTGRIDLFIYNSKNIIENLFEVKSSLDLHSICTAIGQLYMYSFPLRTKPKLIFVCRLDLPEKAEKMLNALNISVLKYSWLKGKPTFFNLKKLIS